MIEVLKTRVTKIDGRLIEYVITDHWPAEMLWGEEILDVAKRNAAKLSGSYQLHGDRLVLVLENGTAEYERQPRGEEEWERASWRFKLVGGSSIEPHP